MAALERRYRHIEHGQMVGHEESIEFAGFELLDQLLDVAKVEIGVGPRAGVPPRDGVDADRQHERAQLELPLCHCLRSASVIVGKEIGTAGRIAIPYASSTSLCIWPP